MTEDQINKTYANLNDILLPKSQSTHNRLIKFYQHEKKDFQGMQDNIEKFIGELRLKINESQQTIKQIQKQSQKDQDLKNKASPFITAKSQELKSKNKNIESIISSLKQSVGKIKVVDLAELPVTKQRCLEDIFLMFYTVLYSEKEPFNWESFKKKALKHEEGEDFQSRLANVNIRGLNQQQHDLILKAKQNPQFNKLCEDPKLIHQLIDIGDWMEYVCAGYKFVEQRKIIEKDLEKITREVAKRKIYGKEQQQRLQFWKQTTLQVQEFQNGLQQIESRLKGIQFGVSNSIPKIKQNIQKTNIRVMELNKI